MIEPCVALDFLDTLQELKIAPEQLNILDLLLVEVKRVVLLDGRAGLMCLIIGSGHRQLLPLLYLNESI